jgi:PAS domain S-box-containing protein
VDTARRAEDETLARMAVRVAKLGGWIFSVRDQSLVWSDTTTAIHDEPSGFSPSSVEDALRYVAPEYREHVLRTFGGCIDSGVPFETEFEIVTAKRRRVWVRSIGEGVRDASGVVTAVHGTFQDISEQKLAAGQLHGIAGRLHDALETMGDAFFTIDREWRFTYMNAEAERLLSRTRALLLGQSIWQEFPHIAGTPADTEFHRAMTAAGTARFEQYEPHVERWYAVEAHPTREGIAVYFRDMTERRRDAANYVARMEGRYRGLLEAAPDAMVVVNHAGEIVILNLQAEKRFGYARDEMLGKTIQMLIPEGFTERLIADGTRTAAEALAQQIGTGIELSARRKDGSTFPIELMLSPLESAEGILVTAAIRDISLRKDADEHLAQMERRYRGLLEAAPDAMVVVNQRGEIVLLNLQAEKRFGYHRDELVGQQVTNIIPEGFAERLIADGTRTAAEALAQQIGTGIELSARRKDGSSFPIEIMLSPLHSDEGVLVTAAIRDISVRKMLDTHLAQMEARYRGLLEAAPDALVVVNDVGEIVILNTQLKRLFGYMRAEMLGRSIQMLIPEGFAERLIADGTRTAAEALAQQIGTGIELSARRKDGSSFPIELMLSPLQSDEGILVTAAIRDISVRKDAETRLAQMEGRYRGLLEAAPMAMVLVNGTGGIVLVNLQAEKQFGHHRDELVGQHIKKIIPEDAAEFLILDAVQSTADALAEQIRIGSELNGRHANGTIFPIEIVLSPLRSDEGVLVSVAIRDITAQKKAEAQLVHTVEELNRSNAELEQFAYIASHDLQEPLRMVASYTQLLSKRYTGKLDADADEFIGFAVDGANRMQRLIQDLLAYSRIGTKRKELMATSSEKALTQAVLNLGSAIDESGALVTHDPLPTIFADEGQLVQLFQNLLGNAIKYQSPGVPKIHVSSTKTDDRRWTFSVQDNGLGIESKYFERIFGMFQRLHKREAFAGTGIGLAICKKIVERHGGKISVDSRFGEGSTFRFDLGGR